MQIFPQQINDRCKKDKRAKCFSYIFMIPCEYDDSSKRSREKKVVFFKKFF